MGLILRFETDDGRTADVHGGCGFLNWEPLGVTEFRDSIISGKPLPLRICKAQTSVVGGETDFSGASNVEFSWHPSFSLKVFALIPGGWLPAALCESTLLLPDANLAGKFSLLEDEASRLRAATGLTDVPLLEMGTNRISAAFAAFETGSGKPPSYAEYKDKIKNIAQRLRRGFPSREVVFPNQAVISAAFAAFQEELPAYERSAAYLAQVFPLISHKVADAALTSRLEKLDALAAQFGVHRTSFVHLLAVDCVFDEGPVLKKYQRPGRLVLKPKKTFTDADLFNALSDVFHMDRLCKAHLVRTGEHPVLCTMDYGLAQAWAMLGPRPIRSANGNLTVRFRVDDSFAPRLSPAACKAYFEQLMG